MDVRMPDGAIIRGVPEGVTKEELQQRYAASQPQVPINDEGTEFAQPTAIGQKEGPSASDSAVEAFNRVVGERLGLDPENYRKVYEVIGPLMPFVNAGVAGMETVAGGIDAGLAGGARAVANTAGTYQGSERPERDTVLLGHIAQLLAGAAPVQAAKAPRAAAQLSQGQKVIQAANRQGVNVLPADVAGPAVKTATSGAVKTPFGAKPIASQSAKNVERIGERVEEIATEQGSVRASTELGETLQRGADKYITQSSREGARLYRDAEKIAGDILVTPRDAVGTVQSQIAELSRSPNTNKAKIDALNELLADITDSSGNALPVSIQTLRDLRTGARDSLKAKGLRGGDIDRRVSKVIDALNRDAQRDLSPEVSAAYTKADRFWKTRVEAIDEALTRILGAKGQLSAEQTAQRIAQLSSNRGDSRALQRTLSTLPAEQRQDVVASVIGNLGKAKPDSDFSVATFLTQYENMSNKARIVVFPKESRDALNDLVTVAKALRESQKYANVSNTGTPVAQVVTAAVFGTDPVTGTALAGAQLAGGRLLASPKFARWLGRAAKAERARADGRDVRKVMDGLNRELVVLSNTKDIGPDIQQLLSGVNRAAAEEENPEVPQ